MTKPTDQTTDEDEPMPRLAITYEAASHGVSVILRWKSRRPTRREARQMCELLYREADRLTNALGG